MTTTTGDDVQLVTFRVAGQDFAFNIFQVERILRYESPAPLKDDTRIMVLEWDGGRIGMVVDAVTEVMQIAAGQVNAPPAIVKGLAADYITGLVGREGRTIIVLNTGKLLASKEKLALAIALREKE